MTDNKFTNYSLLIFIASSVLLAGCVMSRSARNYKVGEPYKINNVRYAPQLSYGDKVGVASWYGNEFHGRKTADGEIFDQYKLTAANPVMPLPSYARVTNLDNKRSLIVRVNDRGPYRKGRIIDLSRAAADKLGYLNHGTARVRVEFLGLAPLTPDDDHILHTSYREGDKVAMTSLPRLSLQDDKKAKSLFQVYRRK